MHRLNGGHALQFSHSGIFASAARPCSIFASAARLCGSVTVASLHQQLGLAVQSQRRPGQQHLPDGSLPQCRHPLRHGTPCQQLCRSAQASSSATAPLPATNLIRRRRVLRFGYQSDAPGPDLLTRSFGVRPFIAPIHISARLPCCHLGAAAQTDANLSAHLRRLPTPPTYLRRMRLSPGRWRRFLIGDMAAVWLGVLFEQFTARTNPCSRHLWGTLARSVASI